MANEISMAHKQTIATLHGQGLSNRQIARTLELDRGTVNRQVALLKRQNRPGAPTGNFSGNEQDSVAEGAVTKGSVGSGSTPRSAWQVPGWQGAVGAASEKGADALGAASGEGSAGLEDGPKGGTTEAPAGKAAENDGIQDEAPSGNWGRSSAIGEVFGDDDAVRNRPGAPTGTLPQKDVLGDVARLSFAIWTEVPANRGGSSVEIRNPPEAPSGKIAENPQRSADETAGTSVASPREMALAVPAIKIPAGSTSLCVAFHELIVKKCEQGLQAQRIWQDLVGEHGFTGEYWSVRRYVARLTHRGELPFRRLETAAGVEAQVDFGQGAWVAGSDGKRRRPWVFRVILSHSRKGYCEVVWRQTTQAFLECLENAFRHFGGVPERIVLDNLKAAVSQADWYDPEIHPKLQSFAVHYGTVFLPTKPYTPRHKGKVEGGVKYVKKNGLAGRSFASLAEQNEYLWRWESQVADQRIHGTTKRQVQALFDEQERAALRPLPAQRFPLFREEPRIVHRDGFVEVDKAYYAAPPEYVGRTIWVRWDSRLLRMYDDRWSALFVHALTTPGKFQTHPGAIPAEKVSAVERGVGPLLKKVSRIGPKTRDWAVATVQSRGMEATRVLVGLQALTHQHEASAIERACELALASGAYRLRTIRELLKRDACSTQQQFEFTQEHPVIRPMQDYSLEKLFEFRGDRPEQSPLSGDE